MTVQDNVHLGAFLRRDKKGIAKDLERVYHHFPRLLERRRQSAGSLSGGEQQMLAIGRSLMSSPKLLLLDEPSLGLSPILVEEMFKIIEDINREGTSVLLVEQNVGAALEVAHRGYVLETGKIVFSGTRQELIEQRSGTTGLSWRMKTTFPCFLSRILTQVLYNLLGETFCWIMDDASSCSNI